MLEVSAYSVVLCDIGLPGCSGYEVASHVRRLRGKEPLVVAISGYGQDCVKENARKAGFDSFFSKPADPIALERLLRERARPMAPR
jgi:CheY-like chemotaxis protein